MNSNEQNLELVSGCKTVKPKNLGAFAFHNLEHLLFISRCIYFSYHGTYYHSPINVELPNLQFRVIVAN